MTMRTWIDVTDANGKVYSLWCESGEEEVVKKAFKNISGLQERVTQPVEGGSSWKNLVPSRYSVKEHEYSGSGHPGAGGYIQILEVEDAPDNRQPIVTFWHKESGLEISSGFTEWESIEYAKSAFKMHFPWRIDFKKVKKMPGFVRNVESNYLIPWFYAVGKQIIIGDYVFPENLQNDPVYKIGRKFVLTEYNGKTSIKTCLGCFFSRDKREVIWEDGTTWSDWRYSGNPVPLEETPFKSNLSSIVRCLNESKESFDIFLSDGRILKGRMEKQANKNLAGDYRVRVFLKDFFSSPETEEIEFEPTRECPTILRYLQKKYRKEGVVCFEII